MNAMRSNKIFFGIVGGGPNSWIGHVHRIAARFDNRYTLCAGVFSRNKNISKKFGASLGLDPNRCYSNYSEMALKEAKRKDGIKVVAIMTPPSSHQRIAEKLNEKNINIILDKPFAGDILQAKKLYKKIKSNKKIKYALTHNYSAYPMVREAKKMVELGKIGKVEYLNVEYIQDWSEGEQITSKNAKRILKWKMDKSIVGCSAVLNEIGSHAYHLAMYISGQKAKKIYADVEQISKKIKCLARGGVYGLRIRVYGSKGSLEWIQNDPNYLKFNPSKGAVILKERDFYFSKFSKKFSRVKYGHPEGYLDAFANIYKEFADFLNNKSKKKFFFPNEDEGLETAKFINACKISSNKKKWVEVK